MKIARYIISIASALFAACASVTAPVYENMPVNPTLLDDGVVSIAYLKSLNTGISTIIDKDIFIEGYVVANDWYGEFYKSIVVTDESGGIEISIDDKRLYNIIPLHSRITVSCHGLALGRTGSKITLGAAPSSIYPTDRISAAEIDRYITVHETLKMPDPAELAVTELSAEHISQFVCIRGLQLVEEERGSAWCDDENDADEDETRYLTFTDRHFTDSEGNILTVRTLNGCHYRDEQIPSGTVALAGTADWFDGGYALRIINHYIW